MLTWQVHILELARFFYVLKLNTVTNLIFKPWILYNQIVPKGIINQTGIVCVEMHRYER